MSEEAQQRAAWGDGDGPDEPHGIRYAYTVRKCRCAECRAWNAANRRRQRARVRELAP